MQRRANIYFGAFSLANNIYIDTGKVPVKGKNRKNPAPLIRNRHLYTEIFPEFGPKGLDASRDSGQGQGEPCLEDITIQG